MATRTLLYLALVALGATTGRAQVADAGPDTSLCVNFYTMQASPLPPGATGSWALVAGCGVSTNPVDPLQLVTNLCIGSNTWMWVVDDGGMLSSDIVVITVYDGSQPPASTQQNITVTLPVTSVPLIGTPVPTFPQTCQWTIVSGTGTIAEPWEAVTVASVLNVGDNIFLWTCDNGPCGTSSDTLVVELLEMTTGIANGLEDHLPHFTFDPNTRQLLVRNSSSVNALDVIDPRGRTIIRVGAGTRSISMADQPDGVYIARAIVEDRPVAFRFVVTH
ncbi:MAG: hypothetical protein R2817_02665 [Flavobacteriales bacterium]